MENALEIDEDQAARVANFLQTPMFNYATEMPAISNIVNILQRIEQSCKTYVRIFYDINREYAEKTIPAIVLARKYAFIDSYNNLVIKTLIKCIHSIIEHVTINTNQQYKRLAPLDNFTINKVTGFLNLLKDDCNQCGQLLNADNNLLLRYNTLVNAVIHIVSPSYLNNGSTDKMEILTFPEFEMPNKAPFRALEHLRNSIKWKKHTPEIGELINVLTKFQQEFFIDFETVNDYIVQQLENVEFIAKKSRVGGTTRRRRQKGKKTKQRRRH